MNAHTFSLFTNLEGELLIYVSYFYPHVCEAPCSKYHGIKILHLSHY